MCDWPRSLVCTAKTQEMKFPCERWLGAGKGGGSKLPAMVPTQPTGCSVCDLNLGKKILKPVPGMTCLDTKS